MAARGWGPEGAGQLQTSLLAGFLPSFSRSPHRAPRPTWVPGLDRPRALSLIPRLHQPCCAPPPNQTLTAPTLPALQHHLGSPPSSHSPWVRPGQGQGCPRASWPEGPARCPGAQGDQVCPAALWAFISSQQVSHRSWLSQEPASSGWQSSAGPQFVLVTYLSVLRSPVHPGNPRPPSSPSGLPEPTSSRLLLQAWGSSED